MNWLRKFMLGRYGVDQLSTFLIVSSVLLLILSRMLNIGLLNLISLGLLIYAYYRAFSKKVYKRSFENTKFLKATYPIRSKTKSLFNKVKGLKKYKYFKCSECNQELRVPRGKGKVALTCPKCGNKMIRRT